MGTLDLNDVDRIGSVRDAKSFMLPPEAWTTALNMRVENGEIKRLLGWAQVFGTPGVAPHFHMPISTVSETFWLYTSLTKAYGYDGTTHTNITRQTASVDVNYTPSDTREWNGTLLGGVPILNSGVDIPQYWPTIALATKLANLTNWDANVRTKVLRAFGPFLLLLNVTVSGVNFAHRVRWSHPADPGTIPTSYDIADPTKDAGEVDLADVNSGIIYDGLPLGSYFYVYKGTSTWRLRFVGGRKIFDFGDAAWLTTSGILAPRCATLAKRGTCHVVVTQDDIIAHNGNDPKSIVTERWRKTFFDSLDTTNFINSFCFDNPLKNEVWVCYPSSGQSQPDRALILNYAREGWVITEADGIDFRNAAVGPVVGQDTATWDTGTATWDEENDPWEQVERRRVIAASPSNTKFWDIDRSNTRNGATFTATLQREGLALLGRKRNGEWIVDFEVMKLFKRIWPKMSGGPIKIRIGVQQLVEGTILWGPYYSFNPATGEVSRPLGVTADPVPMSGRALAVEFATDAAVPWGLSGYKVDVDPMGSF